MARALRSTRDLDALEGLLRQHLRVAGRLEALSARAAEYDTRPAELGDLEAEEKRLRAALARTLRAWLERLK